MKIAEMLLSTVELMSPFLTVTWLVLAMPVKPAVDLHDWISSGTGKNLRRHQLLYQASVFGNRWAAISNTLSPSYFSILFLSLFSDSVNARTLSVGVGVDGPMTVQACLDVCQNSGYHLGGLEFATQCCKLLISLKCCRITNNTPRSLRCSIRERRCTIGR